jgi:hypothetical protein
VAGGQVLRSKFSVFIVIFSQGRGPSCADLFRV